MFRTFPGTLIALFVISCMVGVCVGLRIAVLPRSKAVRDLWRVATRVQSATIGILLVVSAVFGIGCRSHSSARAPVADTTAVNFVTKYDFWEFSWFHLSCLGLCLVMAVLFYRCRMFRLTHQLNIRFQERLAERSRIAQELHDTLLQSFQGLLLCFQIATDTVLADPPEAKELLEQALNRADQALAESRKAIQGIRSVVFAGSGLA